MEVEKGGVVEADEMEAMEEEGVGLKVEAQRGAGRSVDPYPGSNFVFCSLFLMLCSVIWF